MKHIQSYFIILCTLFGCNANQIKENSQEVDKITFASQDYMRKGPFIAVEVTDALRLKYFGGQNSSPEGFYYGNISENQWYSIISILNNINYQDLDTVFPIMVDDRSIEMFIHSGSKVKHIVAQESRLSQEVINGFDQIINIYKTIALEKTNDSLIFETHIQEFNPPPLEQKIDFQAPK